MVVFVDMVLLENFIVNLFLLIITAQTLCTKVRTKKLVLVSIGAASYTLVLFVDNLKFMTILPIKLVIALMIVYFTFGKNSILFTLKAGLIYILYTFVMAGIIIFLEYRNFESPTKGLVITEFSSRKLIITLIVIYIVFSRVVSYIMDKQKLRSYIYDIEIMTKGGSVKLRALLDTGNELKEPVTNLPVIIVEKEIFMKIDTSIYDKLYIPYKVICGQSNFIEAFKPESIKINYDKNKFQYKNVVVGISETKLSQYDEYQALLSRDII